MLYDCAIIGGGPSGLSAALSLARGRKRTILFDDNQARHKVTKHSHGYLTQDGISPHDFKLTAQKEILNYPDIEIKKQKVLKIRKIKDAFRIETENNESFKAKKIILATGLKEALPNIPDIVSFYGKSIFSCPFCDGWELRDRKLIVIIEDKTTMHLVKLISNWTDKLTLLTNGHNFLSDDEKRLIESKNVQVKEQKISSLIGENGNIKKVEFTDSDEILCEGGFISTKWYQANNFHVNLRYKLNNHGGIMIDHLKRTNQKGIFACGDTTISAPAQLIVAAAEGSIAAMSVINELTSEAFNNKFA